MKFNLKIVISVLINLFFVSQVRGTVIAQLNVIFETFSPTSMIRFFEFSDAGWNITEKCIKDMFLYLDGLHKDVVWAVKLYDAGGYYAGSIHAGNNMRLGDSQLCRDLNEEYDIFEHRSKYSAHSTMYEEFKSYLNPSAVLPFRVQLVKARYKTVVESSPFHSYLIHQSVCMPISCSHGDLMQVMTYANISHLRNNLIMKNSELIDVQILEEDYQFYMDGAFYWIIALTSVFLFLGAFGSILECCMNFDVKINLMRIEHKNSINATAAQLTNRLNNLTTTSRNHKNSENQRNNLNTMKSNILHLKEHKVDNVSTISMDLLSHKCNKIPSSPDEISMSTADFNSCLLRRFLLAFSWRKNLEILFSVSPEHCTTDFIEISGLRFITMLWILMVHVCTVLYFVSDNKLYKYRHGFNIVQEFLDNGSLAFDVHFFFSGICIARMFFNRMKSIDIEAICSCFNTLVHISLMIMFKVFSMTFPYIITLLLLQICMKHFNDYSIIDIPSMDHQTCEENLWRNIFYIDQFYPLEQRCMLWSWILSVEVQCFIVACVILLIFESHPRFGIIIFSSFVVCSFVATTTLSLDGDHGMHNKINSSLIANENLAFFNGLYEKPWARLTPYIFGICCGYFLHRIDGKIDVSLVVMSCGWITCSFLVIALILSKVAASSTTISTFTYAMLSLVIIWLILASISKHRGPIGRFLTSKYMLPLNKISNCFFMIHPLVTRILILSSDTSFHLSFAMIITIYLGVAVLTIFFSFFLYMIYEAPVDELLRILYNRKMKYNLFYHCSS